MSLFNLSVLLFAVIHLRASATVVTVINSVDATIYRNGYVIQVVPRGVNNLHLQLTQGDVLALSVNPPTTTAFTLSIKADVQPRIVWRYSGQVTGDAWTKKIWSQSCSWAAARTTDDRLVHRGTGGVPTYFRGIVGEACKTMQLSVAANERAWMFLNNRHLGDVNSMLTTWTKTMSVGEGDVITIKTMTGGVGGVIANAKIDGKNYAIGKTNGWRINTVDGDAVERSMANTFSDCAWGTGSPASSGITRASGFPYSTGAEYLWQSGATTQDIVVARFVVGSEDRCTEAASSGETMCSCEMIPPNAWSDCYYFTDNREYYCKLRKCEPKYMCSSKQTGVICVKRLVTERIVPVEGFKGVCKTEAQRTMMFVPYQQAN